MDRNQSRVLCPVQRAANRVRYAEAQPIGWAWQYAEVGVSTSVESVNPHALGPVAARVDHDLCELQASVDFLRLLTPVDNGEGLEDFRASDFCSPPRFEYLPLPADLGQLLHRLSGIGVDEVEDPGLLHLAQEKKVELEHKFRMLEARSTSAFLPLSIKYFGRPDETELRIARLVLAQPCPPGGEAPDGKYVSGSAFAQAARERISSYQAGYRHLDAQVQLLDDMSVGRVVVRGQLLQNRSVRTPLCRVEPLIAHEVEVHILTYYNAAAQPLGMLALGLSGFEPLQEGLGVLAEYLVGGLTFPRLRLLAARVLASDMVADGADFVDVFRLLHRDNDFTMERAFGIARRTLRAGGLTKDAIYLRGLVGVMKYVRSGGDLVPLFAGKMALRHLPLLEQLRQRGILVPMPLRPRFLETDTAKRRLALIRKADDFGKLLVQS